MDSQQMATIDELQGHWVDFRQGIQSATRSESENFPYNTHAEFVDALAKGEVSCPMSVTSMFEAGKLVSTGPWKVFVIANLLPILGPIIVTILSGNLIYLLCLLAIPVGLGLFHPATKKSLGFLGVIMSLGSYTGLAVGVLKDIWLLVLVTSILVFYHVTWTLSAAIHRSLANEAIQNNEKIFCMLWVSGQVFLKLSDGRTFFPDESNDLS